MMIKALHTMKAFQLAASVLFISTIPANAQSFTGCADAGVASASADSVCYSTPVDLTLSGFVATGFQWQSFNGTTWVDETLPGSNTPSYTVTLNTSGLFRAIVSDAGCPDDTSNEITLTVGTIPVPAAAGVSRCGPGIVNLAGTGNGDLEWYSDEVGGTLLATGSNTTAFIPASTTVWLQDNVLGGSSLASALQITEVNLGATDDLEIQNVSPLPVDVTGWQVIISDSYPDINIMNGNIQVLNGVLQPGDILTWNDNAASANYWGSNMLWNPGAYPNFTGWVLILDDQNNLMDFIAWGWPTASIQAMSVIVGSATVTPGSIWTGDGIDASTVAAADGLARIGTSDNNTLSDFTIQPLTIGVTNPQMTLPFTGFGCTSPRVPVAVTISPSDAITINASSTSFCLSGSATLDAVSNNTSYSYTWSPATGLNTTTGASVTSTPPGPGDYTYVVIGDDGNCSNVDTVTISVGAPTVAGTASTFQDTICLGRTTDLLLTGSTGTIQWQSLSGGNWINETGPGSDSPAYTVSPTVNTTYRAYVFSGSCAPDSSASIDITVVSISNPVTTNDSVCGGGSMTLLATGPGNLNWYSDPVGGIPVNSGNSYTFSSFTTTTYYVEAFAGTEYHIGPATSGIGNQNSTTANANYGMAFDVIRPVNLDVVYVFPAQSGTVVVNLRQSAGGPILGTYSQAVTAFQGKTALPVEFTIPVGTGYRLEIAPGGPTLQQNTTGATYPYTVPNGPLSITGYYNPNFASGGIYLWMYDWIVSEGCRSARIPAIGVVVPFPSIPSISQNGNVLTSSSATGNQWLYNGSIISGATGQTLTITQTGNYTVAVTVNGCTTLSAVFQVLTIGMNELAAEMFRIYPNPVKNSLTITFNNGDQKFESIRVTDASGRIIRLDQTEKTITNNTMTIPVEHLSNGIYILELVSNQGVIRKQFVVEH